MKNSVVLLSGGQDSATCLAIALEESNIKHAICIDYGQRHKVELIQAQKIAQLANIPLKVVDLKKSFQSSQTALTNSKIDIFQSSDDIPNTFVPGRNALFLNVAAIEAYHMGASLIYTGVCQTDYSGYPDCREGFIQSMQQSLSLAMDTKFEIKTPLMYLTKAETVWKMQSLQKLEWLAHSHTCYEGKRPACGVCPACKLRITGFQEAVITDPIEYEVTDPE